METQPPTTKKEKTEEIEELDVFEQLQISPEPQKDQKEKIVLFGDLLDRPPFYQRTSTSVDLSGAATTLVCFHFEKYAKIRKAFLLYTEASSADAGVTIKIGKETDDDYYYTGTSEASKAQWYTKEVTLLKRDVQKGDTILFTSAGGKTGTGEIMLILEIVF
jgi:hypothetical protein